VNIFCCVSHSVSVVSLNLGLHQAELVETSNPTKISTIWVTKDSY
jgi:hypothetical protein